MRMTKKEALELSTAEGRAIYPLLYQANQARERLSQGLIDLCSIVSAKTGACPEDCSFCAQSKVSAASIKAHALLSDSEIQQAALSAKGNQARRFCIVASGKTVSENELDKIVKMIAIVQDNGLSPCATLGLMDVHQLKRLKDAGLERYHHNLETSEAFFSQICTTHTFQQKTRTIRSALSLGLSVCSGGIFGLGESWEDRIDMAFALKSLNVDSIPINFLTPISGTPLGGLTPLTALEALKIIALYRLILPDKEIRICGGRPNALKQLDSFMFFAGANGLLIGNYLTTTGKDPAQDIELIESLGFKVSRSFDR
jgi:biotin synthase